MKKIEDLNFYELLEVSPLATSQEIHKAYERIRRVYEPNSVALYSLFTPEETAVIHQRVEDAYRTLMYEDNRRKYDAMLRERNEISEPSAPSQPPPVYQNQIGQQSMTFTDEFLPLPEKDSKPQPVAAVFTPVPEPPAPVAEFIGEFTGPAIKALREQCGQNLRGIADLTKVSVRYLEFIEEENFQKLPARTYIRGFLILYAKALGCANAERLAGDYLKRYDAAMKPLAKK